jgi:subtilisin family serine protease/predicted GH43/DUF377 family glycosyl hydrolase
MKLIVSFIRVVLGSFIVLIILIFTGRSFNKISDVRDKNSIEVVPNVVIIKFKDDPQVEINGIQTANAAVNNMLSINGINSLRRMVKKNNLNLVDPELYDIYNIFHATYSGGQSPALVAANLMTSPLIEYAEPKYIHYICAIPNDSLYPFQSAYYNLIKAPQAWDIVKGEDGDVIIAIVDGGTDIGHPDLAANIWINKDEIPDNNLDDDENGYPDDVYGWNFLAENGDPTGLAETPINADHGTHTAGIVAAVTNNLIGVSGVSWNGTIMAINARSSEDGSIADGYEGIIYAAENGADVINCSWGNYIWGNYNAGSSWGQDVIRYATSKGAVVIGAAGNNNSTTPHYPSSYDLVLSVAATDINDNKWEGSNYGQDIDLCAPGVDILSTYTDSRYGSSSATSMSAPLVAGVVGLVKSLNPEWSGMQAGEQVHVTADSIPAYLGQLGRGRLNAYRAVTESSPSIHFVDYEYVDENNNWVIEAGERVEVYITLLNYLAAVTEVKLILSTSDNIITMIDSEVTLPALQTLQQMTTSVPFVFDVAGHRPGDKPIEFVLLIKAGAYTDQDRFTLEQASAQKNWTKHQGNPVLEPGTLGEWDDQGVGIPCVVFDGIIYRMWYGNDLVSIGYATSLDGINWIKYDDPTTTNSPYAESDPVLNPGLTGTWDSAGVASPSILIVDSTYHMWYAGTVNPVYDSLIQIGHATSTDGIDWIKDTLNNPVLSPGEPGSWDNRWLFYPCVIFYESRYHMWYNAWNGFDDQVRISHATSIDGINWEKDLNNPVLSFGTPASWDYPRVDGPQVVLVDNTFHMWYSGGNYFTWRIGHAISLDGSTWTKDKLPVLDWGPLESWDDSHVGWCRVIFDPTYSALKMWYTGGNEINGYPIKIGYATRSWAPMDIEEKNLKQTSQIFVLSQNYPNPFNPSTTIEFDLPKISDVTLRIYNILGEEVTTLVSDRLTAGSYSYEWNASHLASGVYLYRLSIGSLRGEAGDLVETKKMVLMR